MTDDEPTNGTGDSCTPRASGYRPESPPEWTTNRDRITYQEGQKVLEAQKSDIDDLDDKPLRTVRITALLLGVGVTGIRIIGVGTLNEAVAGLSLLCFFISLVFGVIVYNESDELIGPTADYLGVMRQNSMEAAWDDDLLGSSRTGLATIRKSSNSTGTYLSLVRCSSCLASGRVSQRYLH